MTIGELLDANPRVSVPIEIGCPAELTAPNMEIMAFLGEIRKRLG
jgi:hypothetical protein